MLVYLSIVGEILKYNCLHRKFIAGVKSPVPESVAAKSPLIEERFTSDKTLINFIFENKETLDSLNASSKNIFLIKFIILCYYVKIDQTHGEDFFDEEAKQIARDFIINHRISYDYNILKEIIRKTEDALINDSDLEKMENTFNIINEPYKIEYTKKFAKKTEPIVEVIEEKIPEKNLPKKTKPKLKFSWQHFIF